MEFDESQAIRYMRGAATAAASKYDDDELLNLIDMIYDFYEANGLLDIDADIDDDDDVDIDDIMAYVGRMLAKDKGATLTPDDAAPLVRAYLEYENSLEE